MFRHAIVRKPGRSIIRGLTTSNLGTPDYATALAQHGEYVRTLESCGVAVFVMEADEEFPDGCFVEDPAVVTEKCAVITNPGAASRNGETARVKEALLNFYPALETIPEGTLEGGDVLRIGDHFYIGLSKRTNRDGAGSLLRILEKYGYSGSCIELEEMFHLKTGVTFIGENTVLVAGEFIEKREFDSFRKIIVDPDEMYAANCIRINEHVVMPRGYPKTKARLRENGFSVKEVEMSEYRKIDGGLSCLSLRF